MNDNKEQLERLNLHPAIQFRIGVVDKAYQNITGALDTYLHEQPAVMGLGRTIVNNKDTFTSVIGAGTETTTIEPNTALYRPTLEELRTKVHKAQTDFPLPGESRN